MKIAVIGAGLSGLATAWFLLKYFPSVSITFFDPLGIGGGTSGMAAGLMHPFAGASAKLNQYGLQGWLSTCKLLEVASAKLGKQVANYEGLLRIAITEQQQREYDLSSKKYEDVVWWDAEKVSQVAPSLNFHPGIFIAKSITVDCPLYLQGLWKACEERGALLEKKQIHSLDELEAFDQMIVATGAFINQLFPEKKFPITQVKGQVLELEWPQNLPPLPFALSSHAYILMDKINLRCLVGATYEKNVDSFAIDAQFAADDILPKVKVLIPELEKMPILSCRSGVRASTPNHLPLIQKVNSKCWIITGMGSKGLLYHALYAERLASMIAEKLSLA